MLIIQESAAVVPVAYHFATFACVDEFLQAAVKQFLISFVSLDIINTYSLIKAWKRLEIAPRSRMSTE